MKPLISAMSCSVFALGFFALFGQQIAPVCSVEAKTKAAPIGSPADSFSAPIFC